MSDTYRRYRAIKEALAQCFGQPQGHHARYLETLTALICGIVGSRHVHLPKIADHAPGRGAVQESLIMRYRRWLQNENTTLEQWMLPVAGALLEALSHQPLLLIMDGSTVGRGCMTMMVSVVYGGRALPLAWCVVMGKKGHLSEDLHRALLAQVQTIVPTDATVIFMGDGEFDGIDLQADIRSYGWHYVCRTACNVLITAFGRTFPIGCLALHPGQARVISEATMTQAQYGPVNALAVWEQDYEDPLFLVTSLDDAAQAFACYRQRPYIETFFSDQKSRGFHINASHISAPQRLSRLLIASCLAYIWIIFLGVCARHQPWPRLLHRRHRCDLSLFQLGLRLVAYCLCEGTPIPKGFLPPTLTLNELSL